MKIKIYFEDKPVYLCDEIDKELNEILHHPDAVFIDEISGPAIKSLLHEIKKEEFHAGVLWHNDFEKLKKAFFKNFHLIEAAGGIVQNAKKEILFIFRLGKWDLPKGKLEKGEDLEQCAIREVEEETGIIQLTLQGKTGETFHTYDSFGKHYLKISHWFNMTCDNIQNLVPQTEEDITAIKWVKIKNLKEPLSNTYASIRDITDQFLSNS
ncbi:MAG: NUDIX domain-containing protein [Ferruginibacter sp.]